MHTHTGDRIAVSALTDGLRLVYHASLHFPDSPGSHKRGARTIDDRDRSALLRIWPVKRFLLVHYCAKV